MFFSTLRVKNDPVFPLYYKLETMTIQEYKNWSQKEGLKPSLGSTLIQYKKFIKMQTINVNGYKVTLSIIKDIVLDALGSNHIDHAQVDSSEAAEISKHIFENLEEKNLSKYANIEKTNKLEIEKESFEFLMNLSKELRTQDNRATALPYFYQVMEEEEVLSREYSGDLIFINKEGEDRELREDVDISEALKEFYIDNWEEELDEEDVKHIQENNEDEAIIEQKAKDKAEIEVDSTFLEEELEKLGYEPLWVTTQYRYKNCFLTEKAVKAHIESNGYHYKNPKDYLSHAFRSYELEKLLKIIINLSSNE